jgi:hypothetical protein
MSRTSTDLYVAGRLMHGYDYDKQAWVVDGKYVECGHPKTMDCRCYGRIHAGEETKVSHIAEALHAIVNGL